MISKTKYTNWLKELKQNIYQQQIHSSLQVNSNMLVLYWYLGKEINQKVVVEDWGKGVVTQLSEDLQKNFPESKGFSVRSLVYMQQFANTYPDLLITQQAAALIKNKKNTNMQQPVALMNNNKKAITQQAAALIENIVVQQPAAQIGEHIYTAPNPLLLSIPWGHHMLLLDKIKDYDERIWYIQKTIDNNWSRSILQYQVDTDLYKRQHKRKKATNFNITLPKAQSDLANEIFKDTYIFDFLTLGEKVTEKQLEENLIHHIQKFLIELGAGFAFVGNQYKLKAGRKEYFIDLLFYHLHLRSYVVIELKMGEFEIAYTGQMNAYLNIINDQMKTKADNASIGIILCGSKDDIEVDYALKSVNHPIGVSDYTFKKSLPKNLKDKLPSAKQLQDEVKKFLKQQSKRFKK